jgi:cyanate permease
MAIGGWMAGLLYDQFGTYGPAFAAGVGANVVNLVIVGLLVFRQRQRPSRFA